VKFSLGILVSKAFGTMTDGTGLALPPEEGDAVELGESPIAVAVDEAPPVDAGTTPPVAVAEGS